MSDHWPFELFFTDAFSGIPAHFDFGGLASSCYWVRFSDLSDGEDETRGARGGIVTKAIATAKP